MRPAPVSRLACLLLLAWGCGTRAQGAATNVVLVVTDTLGAQHLGCYGYPRPTSPAIDALAARGRLYPQNHSQGCWTVPSMISMMSGLFVTDEEAVLPPAYPTLAECLRDAGLTTAAFVGNPVLVGERGFERGFEHFSGPDPQGTALSLVGSFERWYAASGAARGRARGFFAWIHPMDPHHPYQPDPEHNLFLDARPGAAQYKARWRAAEARVAELSPNLPSKSFASASQEMLATSNLYDGEVLAVDAGVARLVEFLRQQGELERTLIVFAADHGELLFEQEHYPLELELKLEKYGGLPNGVGDLFAVGHRAWFHEELWNTPLILAGPGISGRERIEGLSANLDLFPTLLEFLGIPAPAALAGSSLWSEPEPQRERLYAHGFGTDAVLERSGLKLILHERRRFLLSGPGERPVELFDLASDPQERQELSAQRRVEAERLRADLENWSTAHARKTITEVGSAATEVLNDLGYLGDE